MPPDVPCRFGSALISPAEREWIDATIAPHLKGVAEREWASGSLREFLADLHGQVDDAKRSGVLSEPAARDARMRIGAAVKTIPGITVREHHVKFPPLVVHFEHRED